MFRIKRAGLLTKIVILALLIYMATALLDLQGQIRQLQGQKESLDRQVAAGVEDPDDPDRVAAIARDKLGLAVPNEKIFVITN